MENESREQWKERIGVGQRSNVLSKGTPSKRTPVIADEGKFRGQEVGFRVEHADGRVDATSTKQEITVMPNVTVARHKEL